MPGIRVFLNTVEYIDILAKYPNSGEKSDFLCVSKSGVNSIEKVQVQPDLSTTVQLTNWESEGIDVYLNGYRHSSWVLDTSSSNFELTTDPAFCTMNTTLCCFSTECDLVRYYDQNTIIDGCVNKGAAEKIVTSAFISQNFGTNLTIARFELSFEWYLKVSIDLGKDAITNKWRNILHVGSDADMRQPAIYFMKDNLNLYVSWNQEVGRQYDQGIISNFDAGMRVNASYDIFVHMVGQKMTVSQRWVRYRHIYHTAHNSYSDFFTQV